MRDSACELWGYRMSEFGDAHCSSFLSQEIRGIWSQLPSIEHKLCPQLRLDRPWGHGLSIQLSPTLASHSRTSWGVFFAGGSRDRLSCKVQALFNLSFWQATALAKAGTSNRRGVGTRTLKYKIWARHSRSTFAFWRLTQRWLLIYPFLLCP